MSTSWTDVCLWRIWRIEHMRFLCVGDACVTMTPWAVVSCSRCCISDISLAVFAFCTASVLQLAVWWEVSVLNHCFAKFSKYLISSLFFKVSELECKCLNTSWERKRNPGFVLLHTQVKLGRTSKSSLHAHIHIHAFPAHHCAHTPPSFLHNALALRGADRLK